MKTEIQHIDSVIAMWKTGLTSSKVCYEDHTNGGHCTKCGECCGAFLPICSQDVLMISEYIHEHDIKPCKHYTGKENVFDTLCPFLNDKNLCNIYEVRPFICRQFKCNKKHITYKDAQLFLKFDFIESNLWSVFFDDDSGIFLLKKIQQFMKIKTGDKTQ